ncbi:hypothetical protein [Trichormus sp. NMC-1]|uniref:hypothetical protein n=1 Tax=Trichormus sp. NMC-1 TaxID=1853259 RepID=UPI00115FC261|nr:hypothetical protein [Trichormus sp. NMC-1]
MSDQKIPEQIEVLLRCDQQLLFIQDVLQRSEISNSLQCELQEQMRSQWQKHENKRQKIQQEKIPNLAEFTTEQYAICDRHLRDSISIYISKIAHCIDSHRERVSQKIRTELFSVTSEDALK